jgi:hypothetical protein
VFGRVEAERLYENSSKPYLICRTKSDLNIENSDGWDHFNEKVLDISSINKNGLDLLVNSVVNLLK